MPQHAKLSPSSADRWMACPASAVLGDAVARTSSRYADEGTAAHALASECLGEGKPPAGFRGRYIVVDPATGDTRFSDEDEENAFLVDEEMVTNVTTYVEQVRAAAGDDLLLVEQELGLEPLTGEADASGTADAIILRPGELEVRDLKYGQGIVVSAEGNRQLMTYAAAALIRYRDMGPFEFVTLGIHQPRVRDEPSLVVYPVEVIDDFIVEIRAAAERVAACKATAGDWLNKDIAWFSPGEDQCRWCAAKAICPALQSHVEKAMGATVEMFDDLDAEELIADTRTWPEATLAEKAAACDLIEQWVEAVRSALNAALQEGKPVPGFKLVRAAAGHRRWSDESLAEKALKSLKVGERYTRKLISPTQAEKLMGPKSPGFAARRWARVEKLVVRPEGKLVPAPETDKREAVQINPAGEFDNRDAQEMV